MPCFQVMSAGTSALPVTLQHRGKGLSTIEYTKTSTFILILLERLEINNFETIMF